MNIINKIKIGRIAQLACSNLALSHWFRRLLFPLPVAKAELKCCSVSLVFA